MKTEERAVFTFPTTTDAMHMEYLCGRMNLPGRMIPVPTSISAGCGLAWSAPPEARERTEAAAREQGVRVEAVTVLVL